MNEYGCGPIKFALERAGWAWTVYGPSFENPCFDASIVILLKCKSDPIAPTKILSSRPMSHVVNANLFPSPFLQRESAPDVFEKQEDVVNEEKIDIE